MLRNLLTYWNLSFSQVQTVSFLTYLLKSFAECIRPHEESISKSIVNLLVTCPDSVSIRKVCLLSVLIFLLQINRMAIQQVEDIFHIFWQELLVATRHVLATEFRRGFFPLIDKILEERYVFPACVPDLGTLEYVYNQNGNV